MADDDRKETEVDADGLVRRAECEPGDDPRQRDRQDDDERDGVAPEEAEAGDGERRERADDHREEGRAEGGLDREPERATYALVVVGDREPLSREVLDRPALRHALVEGVDANKDERQVDEEQRQSRAEAKEHARQT